MGSKHFVVQLTFPRGAPTPEERQAQQQFLKRLVEEGTLMIAGVYPDERGGGMAVIRAGSVEEARLIYDESPLVAANRVDLDVREWKITWGLAEQ